MTKIATQIFKRSVCFVYDTRVFSLTRDATIERRSPTRRRKDVQDIIDKKHVRDFGSLKQEAFRSCRSMGTKLNIINAWITPEENEQAQWAALEDIQKRWDHFTNTDVYPNYQSWVNEHARANPTESLDAIVAHLKRADRHAGLGRHLGGVDQKSRIVVTAGGKKQGKHQKTKDFFHVSVRSAGNWDCVLWCAPVVSPPPPPC